MLSTAWSVEEMIDFRNIPITLDLANMSMMKPNSHLLRRMSGLSVHVYMQLVHTSCAYWWNLSDLYSLKCALFEGPQEGRDKIRKGCVARSKRGMGQDPQGVCGKVQ